MALTIRNTIKDDGFNQGDVYRLLSNVVDLVNELQTDHASNVTTVDALVTLTTELRTDHATFKTAVDDLNTLTDELHDDHASVKTVVDEIKVLTNSLRTQELTRCVTPPTFVIDTNFDVKNSVAFEVISSGTLVTIAANQSFDTGTGVTNITTVSYWAGAILSIDAGGTTYVDWGAEDVAEAGAITNLAAVTASGEVVCGYMTVHAKAGEDFVSNTDALTSGTGGQVAQATNYYNIQGVGDAAMGAAVSNSHPATITASKATAGPAGITAAAATAGPVTLTNSTALTLG